MNIIEMKNRRDYILTRIKEIHAQLAEYKRAWIVEKIPTELSVRLTLEAEKAAIEFELSELYLKIDAYRKAESQIKEASFMAVLCKMLIEKGHEALIKEARRESIGLMLGAIKENEKSACN